MGQSASEGRPGEAGTFGISALQQRDRLQMLGLRRLHAAHDIQFVRNARALRHERGKVNAWSFSRQASEWAAARAARFRVPRFELAGRPAEPQESAMLLRFLRRRREDWIFEQPRETRHARERPTGQAFQEKPAMKPMLVHWALPHWR